MTTDMVPLIAPLAAFAVVCLLGLGFYRTANHGGLIARKRLAAYTPAATAAVLRGMSLEGSPLLRRQTFSSIGVLERFLRRKERGEKLSLELARAALPLRVGEYLLMRWLIAAGFMFLVLSFSHLVPIALIGGAMGYFLPLFYVRLRQAKRVRQFDDQLVDALTLAANALKSGYSFLQGMEAIAREMPSPIGIEFEQALREIRVGGAVEDALLNVSKRVRSKDFELVVTAMVIQRQVGGNLTEILGNIAYTVRERHRILREIRVLTAQERLSGYVIAGLPVFLVVVLSVISPDYIKGMTSQNGGTMLLVVGFILELLGLLVIRKIVDIDV